MYTCICSISRLNQVVVKLKDPNSSFQKSLSSFRQIQPSFCRRICQIVAFFSLMLIDMSMAIARATKPPGKVALNGIEEQTVRKNQRGSLSFFGGLKGPVLSIRDGSRNTPESVLRIRVKERWIGFVN